MKVKVRSPDGDTHYFNVVAHLLQGDTLAAYPLIIYQDYVLRKSIDKMKDNSFKLTKEKEDTPTYNYERGLRGWYSASGKCTRLRRTSAT